MNVDDNVTCANLFGNGKFTECCELLQRTFDERRVNEIGPRDEVELIALRNNLLVCNCLRILSTMSVEYVGRMTEFINVSKLYLYEKHVPLELRVNFVCNTLHWYWLKPFDVPDYCYDEIITLVDECLHQVLQETGVGKNNVNLSTHVGVEQDILNTLERLSNRFLSLEPLLVVQCLEISQLLMLVFLSRRCFTSALAQFTKQLLDQIDTIMCAFKYKKSNCVANCFKLGLLKINIFLDAENAMKTIIVSAYVTLSVGHILENQHLQALCTLSTVDRYLDPDDELFSLVYYLKALANFNSGEHEVALYYLSQIADCLMEPFAKSRCYLLLGRAYSVMGNNDLTISTFEKLQNSAFNKIMAYYMSQHYERNNMQFTQIMVLEQAIKGGFYGNNDDDHKDFSISYISKVLKVLHPQPDLTRKQLLYLAAKKKFEHGNYKLAASAYLNVLSSNEVEQCVSDLVMIPSTFMLKHEAAVVLLKAHEMEEAFNLCRSLIEDFIPGYGLWKSDEFWADELNDYDFNVVGTMLMAETGFNKNADFVLEALNKSFNCLYAKICCDHSTTETDMYDERIRTLRQILIGKILLLRAVVFSKIDNDENCEAAFKKALSYNSGDEDIVYLYSKWLEHKGKISQSMDVRGQFDHSKINSIVCNNIAMTHVLENKHGLEDTIVDGTSIIDDLFASSDENVIDVDHEMDPADDDIFNDLFLD